MVSYEAFQIVIGLWLITAAVLFATWIYFWGDRKSLVQEIRRLEMKAENDRHTLGYFLGQFIARFIKPLADNLVKELPVTPEKPRIPKIQYAKLRDAVEFATDLFTTMGVGVTDDIGSFLDRYGIVFERVGGGKGAASHTYNLDAGAKDLNKDFVVTYR
ncbi:hypothetical protein A2886_01520 [candidate division WWE3 bacterium RIFCSPHIGHO2_01_FULL_42_13]|uniref:Uncharacterized protein n=1 Tax=candidate division WWE3 bacterium RIFCSPHIGHO2_01_FULL_42_13 TaxID=1802617 RepID=A0A1F4USH2_UNCKA|nr:MAG: hypothetical protein A2886_01520 [candidate division WWE3 bacterium RIFCSPHIGHO2_01_FULL_42_13]